MSGERPRPRAVKDEQSRTDAVRGVTVALARAGKVDEALALARSIAEDTARADALRGIATAMPE